MSGKQRVWLPLYCSHHIFQLALVLEPRRKIHSLLVTPGQELSVPWKQVLGQGQDDAYNASIEYETSCI